MGVTDGGRPPPDERSPGPVEPAALARSPYRDQHPPRERDVYARVWRVGDRAVTVGAAFGIIVALLGHGMGVARAAMSLSDMLDWLRGTRGEIARYYYETYDVELPPEPPKEEEQKPPEPPPEPEPEPEPAPKPDTPPPPVEDPYKDAPPPPPAAAAAQELLTAKSDERLDFGDEGFVTGKGPGGVGYVAADGTEKESRNPRAKPGGTPGATGTGQPGAGPPPGPDLSRPPTIAGGTSWNCPFPPEADAAQVDQAVVTVVVTVRPDGSPQSVQVVSDPGNGFGRAARTCALGRRYQTGLDRAGQPTTAATPPIRVRFTR